MQSRSLCIAIYQANRNRRTILSKKTSNIEEATKKIDMNKTSNTVKGAKKTDMHPKTTTKHPVGTVQVFCRVRPSAASDRAGPPSLMVDPTDPGVIVLTPPIPGCQNGKQYSFDRVFDVTATQQDIFKSVGHPLIEGLLGGRNGLLFAYGVTGSGKTHTMCATGKDRGIMPRCLNALFQAIGNGQMKLYVKFVEIYNNNVYDLLEKKTANKTRQSKMIREDSKHQMYVQGVTEVHVKSYEEGLNLFRTVLKTRQMASTKLNAQSSRSHMVFTLRLVQQDVSDPCKTIVSQLSLVDLAGSERTKRTDNTGQRLREAGTINNSLMTLRTCLSVLREHQRSSSTKIIPYRDSKLTLLFKNDFEGDANVGIMVCVSPQSDQYEETKEVLSFAKMAQDVQLFRSSPSPPITTEAGTLPDHMPGKILKPESLKRNEQSPGSSQQQKKDTAQGRVRMLIDMHELKIKEETAARNEQLAWLQKNQHKMRDAGGGDGATSSNNKCRPWY